MNLETIIPRTAERKCGNEKLRILAFGSSNTERRIAGTHWLDCLELAIKNKYGRIHHCINSGVGGETSTDLLARFETDAVFYRPDIAFITIGGNDAAADLTPRQYRNNLCDLASQFAEFSCQVVFQTYYMPIAGESDEKHLEVFYELMDIVRGVAAETGAGLIDHLRLWKPFADRMPAKHLSLMLDAWHVNETGNVVLGLTIVKEFGLELAVPGSSVFRKAGSLLDEMGAMGV